MERKRNALARGTTGLRDLRAHHAHVSRATWHGATLAGRRHRLWAALSRRTEPAYLGARGGHTVSVEGWRCSVELRRANNSKDSKKLARMGL